MTVKAAINGFGRIGRMTFRAGLPYKDIEFVGINDLTDPSTLAHLLKYDSSQGVLDADVSCTDHSLIINGKEVRITGKKTLRRFHGARSVLKSSLSVRACLGIERRHQPTWRPEPKRSLFPRLQKTRTRPLSWV